MVIEFDNYTFGAMYQFNESAYGSSYAVVVGMDVVIQLLCAILVVMLIYLPVFIFILRRRT